MLRRWLRKVATGLAAFFVVCLEALGSANIGYGMGPYVPHYTWTETGMRMQMEIDRARHEQIARLEGDIHEDQVRREARRSGRDRGADSSVS